MGNQEEVAKAEATARNWLEDAAIRAEKVLRGEDTPWDGGYANALPLYGLRVHHAADGRCLCSLTIPPHLTDEDGKWHGGAIVAAVDDICAATIATKQGNIQISVQFDISFFAAAQVQEEVEFEGRVEERKGRMTAVTVEVRKKESRELVAIGRQWMTSPPKSLPAPKTNSRL